ncbi:HprK-related kinase B [Gilvimarinus xylanilyticus]|uniref:HprK-related kinase B n=1 Tax=Gilvimarinus xylanilyticus TaxID=2944139 RepID=A0A9X2KTL1_9GAMM|nr:HprK-related kinase B [Gilvimarinus xylanilyticus]MCP8899307.1 HprK-related kinase B [Gilvimarinus xylanilyticus]
MGEAKHQPQDTTQDFLGWLQNTKGAAEHSLSLALPGAQLQVNCSDAFTASTLRAYFQPWLTAPSALPATTVTIIESQPVGQELPWLDWTREAGKTGRKDTFIDAPGVRLIRKYRTGMVFLQAPRNPIAIGPAAKNINQVVNFINNQAINALQQDDWLIGHAAAASYNRQAIAIAGFSGGGKSTSMLQLLEHPAVNFVSNDRIFIQPQAQQLMLTGVAKMPRVNPGTLLHNPRLLALLSPAQQHRYKTLAPEQLWELEEKHDVMIPALYGKADNPRIDNSATLGAIMLLNWNRAEQSACRIQSVDIEARQDLLPALMKSPGPFYQDRQGNFHPNAQAPQPYLERLKHTQVYEVSGGVDFTELRDFCWQLWGIPRSAP